KLKRAVFNFDDVINEFGTKSGKNMFLLNENIYNFIKLICDKFMEILNFCRSFEDLSLNLNKLLNELPKTHYDNIFKNRIKIFMNLTSIRDGKKIHKIAIQLNNIKNQELVKKINNYIDSIAIEQLNIFYKI